MRVGERNYTHIAIDRQVGRWTVNSVSLIVEEVLPAWKNTAEPLEVYRIAIKFTEVCPISSLSDILNCMKFRIITGLVKLNKGKETHKFKKTYNRNCG